MAHLPVPLAPAANAQPQQMAEPWLELMDWHHLRNVTINSVITFGRSEPSNPERTVQIKSCSEVTVLVNSAYTTVFTMMFRNSSCFDPLAGGNVIILFTYNVR